MPGPFSADALLARIERQLGRIPKAPKAPPPPRPAHKPAPAAGSGPAGAPADLGALIARLGGSPARQSAMHAQVAAARETARVTREQARAAQAQAATGPALAPEATGVAPAAPTYTPYGSYAAPRPAPRGPQVYAHDFEGKAGESGPRILLDQEVPVPHTLTTRTGRHCETNRWFDRAFLVYDPSIPPDQRGSENHPWFGVSGPGFRCYYPQSSEADFESILTSGSSGRWLHAYGQRANYVQF